MIIRVGMNYHALVVLLPIGAVLSIMLYFIGARWTLLLPAVVTVLLCLNWSRDPSGATDPSPTLPVQQPGATPASMVAAFPREPPAGLRCVGMSFIAGIPLYEYKKKAGRGSGDVCAICLSEVRRGQVVKQLPSCMHLFHKSCIDEWLTSHATCPVCRSPVDCAPAALQAV